MEKNVDTNNDACYSHKIEYYRYKGKVLGVVPSMDRSFLLNKDTERPIALLSKEKPIFHESYSRKPRIKRVFVLTSACNLQCSYCFEGEHAATEVFDVEKLKAGIQQMFTEAASLNKKLISFSLFGGEPTMNWDAVEVAVKLAKELEAQTGIQCYKAIVTNGVMPAKHAEYLADNMDFVYFSFDGPKELFLRQRKPKNGSGVYETIFRNAKKVYEKGAYLAFKVTVTKYTLDYLKEIDDFFADEFPTCSRLYQPCMVDESDDLYISFGEFLEKYLELKRYSLFGKNLTTSLYKNKPSDRFCNLMVRNVEYPDGSVLACHRSNMCIPDDEVKRVFKVGYSDAKGIINRSKEKEDYFQKFTVDHIEQCRDCVFRYHCCGGCPTIKLLSKNNEMFRPADYCNDFMKYAFTNIISRLFNSQEPFLLSLPEKIPAKEYSASEEDFWEHCVDRIIMIEE